MVLSTSYSVWKGIDELESEEQMRLLRWQLQAREPIHRFSDMKPGDHLVQKSSSRLGISYEHHFICIGLDYEGRPKIIHYYNTAVNVSKQMIPTSGHGSGTANEKLGIVQEMTLPHKDFIKNEDDLQAKGREVERVLWPEELKRFSVREVISRALKRKGEKFFDLKKNNCESFVMWCLCDLNISLQVTPLRKALCDTGSGVLRSIWHLLQQIPKVVTEFLDDFGVAIGRGATRSAIGQGVPRAISKVGVGVGAAVTVIVEAFMAGNDIHNAYKKWNDGILIKSREEFIKEVTDIVMLALSRSGGSIAGMVVGQILIPIPVVGGLVGAVLGVLGGHVVGKFISERSNKTLACLIESIIVTLLEKIHDVMQSARHLLSTPHPHPLKTGRVSDRCTAELRDVISLAFSNVKYFIK